MDNIIYIANLVSNTHMLMWETENLDMSPEEIQELSTDPEIIEIIARYVDKVKQETKN